MYRAPGGQAFQPDSVFQRTPEIPALLFDYLTVKSGTQAGEPVVRLGACLTVWQRNEVYEPVFLAVWPKTYVFFAFTITSGRVTRTLIRRRSPDCPTLSG